MEFKRATINDKSNILELYRSLVGTEYCAWTENYPGETDIEGDMSRNALFCMKNNDNHIVGVISIDRDEAVESLPCWSKHLQPSAELARLGVRNDCQNQGIAKKLLLHAMQELKSQGKKSVHFLVCKTNLKAIRAYSKLNFNIVGECRLYHEDWWCYEKAL
jgi:ribosomal protein S18 acetylase RimI-like enzyme